MAARRACQASRPRADARLHKLNTPAYAVATSAPRIVENFLDLAHFGFVHEGWLGDAGHREVPDHPVEVSAETGVLAHGCQAWQPQGHVESSAGAWVAYDYAVPAPYAAVLAKQPVGVQDWSESIALFICPCDEEQSLVWFRMAVPQGAATDADRLAFQHTIFTQDRPVLESQWPRRLPLGDSVVRELHCAADRSSAAYRRYLRLLDIHFGVC